LYLYGICAPPVFKIIEYMLGENLLETLFVLSFNHQNPQSELIALTIRNNIVMGDKSYKMSLFPRA
jgi:hypothetical protein